MTFDQLEQDAGQLSFDSLDPAPLVTRKNEVKAQLNKEFGTLPSMEQGQEMPMGQAIGEAFRAPYYATQGVVGGLARTVGDILPSDSSVGQQFTEWGDEMAATSEAFSERARESHQYDVAGINLANPAEYATEAGLFMAPPGRLSKGGGLTAKALDYGLVGGLTAYPMFRGDLESTPGEAGLQAGIAGGLSAIIGPAAEGVVGYLTSRNINPQELLDYATLQEPIKRKFEKLGKSFSIEPEELAKRSAEVLETTQYAEKAPRGQVMKAATQAGDLQAGKEYIGKAVSDTPEIGGDILREAGSRHKAVMDNIDPETPIGATIMDNTQFIGEGKIPVTDWKKVAVQAEGMLPPEGPMAKRIQTYSKLNDAELAPFLHKKAFAGDNENAYSPRALASKITLVRWSKKLATELGFFGEEAKIVERIVSTAGQERWAPAKLAETLVESGVDVTKATNLSKTLSDTFPDEGSDVPAHLRPKEVGQLGGQPIVETPAMPGKPIEPATPALDKKVNPVALENARKTGNMQPWKDAQVTEDGITGNDIYHYLQKEYDKDVAENMTRHLFDSGSDTVANFEKLTNSTLDDVRAFVNSNTYRGKNIYSSDSAGGAAVGASAGVEQNEDGSYGFDPVKGLAGAAIGATVASKGFRDTTFGQAGKTINGVTAPGNMRPGIIPGNSSAASEGGYQLAQKGWGLEDIAELGKRQEGNYDYYSPMLKALQKDNAPTTATPDRWEKYFKKQGITGEELSQLKASHLRLMPKDSKGRVSKEEVMRMMERRAGTEIPLEKANQSYPNNTANDFGTADDTVRKELVNNNWVALEEKLKIDPEVDNAFIDDIAENIKLGRYEDAMDDLGEVLELADDPSVQQIMDMRTMLDGRSVMPKDYKVSMRNTTDVYDGYSDHMVKQEPYYTRTSKVSDELLEEGVADGVVLQEIQQDMKDGIYQDTYVTRGIEDAMVEMRQSGKNNLYIPLSDASNPNKAPSGMEYRDATSRKGKSSTTTSKFYWDKVNKTAKKVAKRYGLNSSIETIGDTRVIRLTDPSNGGNKWHFPLYGKGGSFEEPSTGAGAQLKALSPEIEGEI